MKQRTQSTGLNATDKPLFPAGIDQIGNQPWNVVDGSAGSRIVDSAEANMLR